MTIKKVKLLTLLGAGASVAILPFLTMACVTSNTPVVEERQLTSNLTSQVESELAKIRVESASSTHAAVQWTSVPSFSYWIANNLKIAYASTKTAQLADETSAWANFLPLKIAAEPSERFLWARVASADNSSSQATFNLTTSSNVASVKILLDSLPEVSSINLRAIAFLGTVENLHIYNAPEQPYVKAVFSINDDNEWLAKDEFITKIQASLPTAKNIATIKATLSVLKPAQSILKVNHQAQPNLDHLLFPEAASPLQPFIETLSNIKRAPEATSESARFINLPSDSELAQSNIELLFRTSVVNQGENINEAEAWSKHLPTVLAIEPNKRELYVLIKPIVIKDWAPVLVNLTVSSQIRSIPNNLNLDPFVNSINLAEVKLVGKGRAMHADYVYLDQLEERALKLQWAVALDETPVWFASFEAFIDFLSTHEMAAQSAEEIASKMLVRLQHDVLSRNYQPGYELTNLRVAKPDASGAIMLNLLSAKERAFDAISLIKINYVNSAFNNINWSMPSQLKTDIAPNLEVRYIGSNRDDVWVSIGTYNLGSRSIWTFQPPTAIRYVTTSSYVWAAVIDKEDVSPYINLSNITSVATATLPLLLQNLSGSRDYLTQNVNFFSAIINDSFFKNANNYNHATKQLNVEQFLATKISPLSYTTNLNFNLSKRSQTSAMLSFGFAPSIKVQIRNLDDFLTVLNLVIKMAKVTNWVILAPTITFITENNGQYAPLKNIEIPIVINS